MTNSEAIYQLNAIASGINISKRYDIESISLGIKALEENDKLKAEIDEWKKTVEYHRKKLLEFNNDNADLKAEIERIKNESHRRSDMFLQEIEQLKSELEQSVKLPCKVGDVIYDNDFGSPAPSTIVGYSFGDVYQDSDLEMDMEQIYFYSKSNRFNIDMSFPSSEIGKTIFLTREEAEQSLKGQV